MAPFYRREQLKHRRPGVDPQAPTYIAYTLALFSGAPDAWGKEAAC